MLKDKAKKHGFRSVNKECRFQVINSLYDENFLNNTELNDFKIATSSLNKVSKDLWNFIKLEREMRSLDFNEQFKGYAPIFNEINQAIESYKKGLDIVSKKTQKRIS